MNTDHALAFLAHLVKACPFKIHTILTDNGSQFTYTKAILRRGRGPARRHRFTRACQKHGIRHKTTRPYRPQTNGQVERMNRTIKEATTKTYHYDSVDQLKTHLSSFMSAYNCAKKRSALKRKTPYEAILTWWQKQPKLFNVPFGDIKSLAFRRREVILDIASAMETLDAQLPHEFTQ